MSNERFFRLLSIAILGALALAFVPDSKAGSSASRPMTETQVSMVLPVEIQAVDEADEINAGRFNPALLTPAAKIPSPVQTTTLSQVDPNF